MTSLRRLIVCLDVTNGRVVKGVQFRELRDIGDPALLAGAYESAGADEIVLLDITAAAEHRETRWDTVQRTAESVFIPLTVGGGIRSLSMSAGRCDLAPTRSRSTPRPWHVPRS